MITRLRPRFRYRLTTLLALMVIVAIAATWYGNRMRALERQENAFRQIAAKGGVVHVYSYGTQIYFEDLPPSMCMNGIQRVIEPLDSAGVFRDEDCRLMDQIIDLQRVHFPGSAVSRDGKIKFVCTHRKCRVTNKPFAEWE